MLNTNLSLFIYESNQGIYFQTVEESPQTIESKKRSVIITLVVMGTDRYGWVQINYCKLYRSETKSQSSSRFTLKTTSQGAVPLGPVPANQAMQLA